MIKIRGKEITAQSFAKMLDISLVHPDTSQASIKDLVALVMSQLPAAQDALRGSRPY